ncbi:colicin E3/pyocin S6 family cytotoxin [Hymenobacter norwichensis]|uniref:colicin E3/pyocin S6 family cytotoxin n=1 Tax=Hymenobacter norwichensis TaxID=223903 RepID=UPI0008FFE035
MTYIPIPTPCYLDTCEFLGVINGKKRWRSDSGRLYEWDSLHGEIEVYNRRGKHIAVYDPEGNYKKDAVNGRKIDV